MRYYGLSYTLGRIIGFVRRRYQVQIRLSAESLNLNLLRDKFNFCIVAPELLTYQETLFQNSSFERLNAHSNILLLLNIFWELPSKPLKNHFLCR